MYKCHIEIVVYLQPSFQWLLGIFEFPVWIDQVQVVEHDHDENRLFKIGVGVWGHMIISHVNV